VKVLISDEECVNVSKVYKSGVRMSILKGKMLIRDFLKYKRPCVADFVVYLRACERAKIYQRLRKGFT